MKIIFTLLVFIYLFAYGIKFSGIPISAAISIMSAIYLIYYGLVAKFIAKWEREILVILIIVLYMLVLESVQTINFTTSRFSFYVARILIEGILPAYVLADIAKKFDIKFVDLVFAMLAILIIEYIFSAAMAFIPDFKKFIYVYVNGYGPHHRLMDDELYFFRGFGIAYTYLAWFPFTLALIFIFCLFSGVVKSKIFLFLLSISTFMLIAFNARVGFVPLFLGGAIYIYLRGVRGLLITVLVSALILNTLGFFEVSSQDARINFFRAEIIEKGFLAFFTPEGSITIKHLSNFKILTDVHYADLIFGTGGVLTPQISTLYTDVGYMQTLYTGGLVLSFLLYLLFAILIIKLINTTSILIKIEVLPQIYIYFPLLIAASFVIGHFKLRIFEINEATRFLFLVVSIFIVLSEANFSKRVMLDKKIIDSGKEAEA